MELREVETFLAIVQYGTFSRAAERLGYSQSAVTVQIRQLESELGVRLFDRVPRGAVLTEQGRAFSFHANEIMDAVNMAVASVEEPDVGAGEMKGVVRLGSAESISTAILPELLVAFHRRCPYVQVVVSTDGRESMMESLRNNALDVVLTMERRVCERGLHVEPLRAERVAFVAAPGIVPPVEGGGACDAEALARIPLVLTERGESYRLELDRMLAERGISIEPLVEAGNTETLVHVAERGVGMTFVPRFSAARALERGSLVEVACDLPVVEMESQMLWHERKWIAPHMLEFMDVARSYFAGRL